MCASSFLVVSNGILNNHTHTESVGSGISLARVGYETWCYQQQLTRRSVLVLHCDGHQPLQRRQPTHPLNEYTPNYTPASLKDLRQSFVRVPYIFGMHAFLPWSKKRAAGMQICTGGNHRLWWCGSRPRTSRLCVRRTRNLGHQQNVQYTWLPLLHEDLVKSLAGRWLVTQTGWTAVLHFLLPWWCLRE